MDTVNIAAYRFVGIPSPAEFVSAIKDECDRLNLLGTVILATEGINLFLSGSRESIDSILNYLRTSDIFEGRFAKLEAKESPSTERPFKKMVVRIAREIVTMRHPAICPEAGRAPAVDAATLKVWLDRGCDDDGRELVLLDTRNKFEYDIGTFQGAIELGIDKFSQFPDAVKDQLGKDEIKNKTIVSFCTGGIRCEKAAIFLGELRFKNVFQLEGGILKYFEEVGGDHWKGECFVFDDRIAVDAGLNPSTKDYEGRTAAVKRRHGNGP